MLMLVTIHCKYLTKKYPSTVVHNTCKYDIMSATLSLLSFFGSGGCMMDVLNAKPYLWYNHLFK